MTVDVARRDKAKPFLKWAGGKGQLLEAIGEKLPQELHWGRIETYVEPFVGGGAVFFMIAQQFPQIERFVLIDANQDLIDCYKVIQKHVEELIAQLEEIARHYEGLNEEKRKQYYLKVRNDFNLMKDSQDARVASAAQLMFLNRTCFNGLYRVNRKGQFNVPFGRYKNPRIYDKNNLQSAARLLEHAEIICGDFTQSRSYIGPQSFFYFDPPYRPISKTANFTSYSKDSFTEQDQLKLAEFCGDVDAGGGKFLLSNSDPKNENPNDHFFEEHYCRFGIERVKASRAINCKAGGRGQINELLITNYT